MIIIIIYNIVYYIYIYIYYYHIIINIIIIIIINNHMANCSTERYDAAWFGCGTACHQLL